LAIFDGGINNGTDDGKFLMKRFKLAGYFSFDLPAGARLRLVAVIGMALPLCRWVKPKR